MNSDESLLPMQIKSIYIFSDTGIPLFVRSSDEKQIDDLIMSGFLSAVFSFAEEVVKEGTIKTMEVGTTKFVFKSQGNLVFSIQGTKGISDRFLEYILQQIVDSFCDSYGAKSEILSDVMDMFDSFEEEVKRIFASAPPETTLKEMEHEVKEREKAISLPFLLGSAKKGLDKVIAAIIGGDKPVVVIGDKARVELAVATLERFIHFDNFRTMMWTDRLEEGYDILGCSSTALGKPTRDIVILDIVTQKVMGGQPCRFSRGLLKKLEKLQEKDALALINKKIGELSSAANKIVELNQMGQLDQETFSTIMKNIDPNTVTLLLNICKRVYPNAFPVITTLYEDYMAEPGARLEAFLDDF